MRMCDISGCNKEGRLSEVYFGWGEVKFATDWEGDLCKEHSEKLMEFIKRGMKTR